jgi:hypothetical protein
MLETETIRVLKWLADRAKSFLSASKSAAQGEISVAARDVAAIILTKAGRFKRAFRFEELQAGNRDEREDLQRLLANATLILDARSTTSISRRRAASRSFSRASRRAAPEFTSRICMATVQPQNCCR